MHPLTEYRLAQKPKLSQRKLAARLGVATMTVLRWENGQRVIRDKWVGRISEATGIAPAKLRPDLAQRYGGAGC